ncbi:amidohydrolase family protein [Paracoccus onubensis]|uniref:amidohydrolase family protein n=1 Tax=Paracoccus onubensis TaxID=1675788 RepID=UPI00273049F6|nr:amidohydrolase family protein [Paracoccus onubensis]MDP0929686.1 amidohydrolase family protein [Paracoccus onubensis]
MKAYDPSTNAVRTPAELDAWQAEDSEPILDPDQPIVDSHHHLWRKPEGDFLLPELQRTIGSGHHVVASVAIECGNSFRTSGRQEMRCVGETESIVSAIRGARPGICAGIVSHADLHLDTAVDVLDAQIEAAEGRLRGIRQKLRWDRSGIGLFGQRGQPDLITDPGFRRGFALLAKRGLIFDAWVYHPQLQQVAELARAFPDTTIVVNHCGGPLGVGPYEGRLDDVLVQWRAGINALAACPNVVMKIGGLGMLYYGFNFHQRPKAPKSAELAAAWRPYVDICLAAFGPDRAMMESNWPVDRQSCSYRSLWNAFKRLTAGASENERAQLFHATARHVYRLEEVEPC